MPGKIYLVYGPQTRIVAIPRQQKGESAITCQIRENRKSGEEFRGSISTFFRPNIERAEAVIAQHAEREPITVVVERDLAGKDGPYIEIPRGIRETSRRGELLILAEDMVKEIEIKYGKLGARMNGNIADGLADMIENAIRHGNNGDPQKRVFIGYYKIGNGFALEVIDEGKRSLALISLPAWVRGIVNFFRLNYHGMNIGVSAIRICFGKKNLTAHKLFDKDGNRVGTRIRLAVVD